MDEMNKPGQSFGLGNGQNRSLAGLSPYNPPGVAILFVAAGQCAGVSPTPEVGGVSAFCPLQGHPCPDEVNSPFPVATDHERL